MSNANSSSFRVTSSFESDINLLSFGQHITSLCAGKMDANSDQDVLMIGSQTHVLAYDVNKNADLFYKEVSWLYHR